MIKSLLDSLPVLYSRFLTRLLSCSQVNRGPPTSYHFKITQPNSDHRFRVCAIRQCQDASELSGSYSPTVTLSPQRNDVAVGSSTAGSRSGTESSRARRSLTDEQCAFLLLMVFAVIAILIAFVIQYFVIKWALCTPSCRVTALFSLSPPLSLLFCILHFVFFFLLSTD